MPTLIPFLALLLLAGCAHRPEPTPLQRLSQQLSGHFHSGAQAAADPAYLHIELRVVPVWPERADGPWLYVEQAALTALDKPYRQRVYRLEQRGDRLLSHIYEFKTEPLRQAGAWRQAQPLAALGPDDLQLKPGCEVALRADGDGFQGATRDGSCESRLRGAAWARSTVRLSATQMDSWDQGFDAAGRQVWGAAQGPYRFVRQ